MPGPRRSLTSRGRAAAACVGVIVLIFRRVPRRVRHGRSLTLRIVCHSGYEIVGRVGVAPVGIELAELRHTHRVPLRIVFHRDALVKRVYDLRNPALEVVLILRCVLLRVCPAAIS